jgi:hypothetical protein
VRKSPGDVGRIAGLGEGGTLDLAAGHGLVSEPQEAVEGKPFLSDGDEDHMT